MTSPKILLCSVGGSYQPIVRAIKELSPDFVCFICSGQDPGTGKGGSDIQVVGVGLVIKAGHDDEKPNLPNIPTQCGLKPEQYEVIRVPADDLDAVYTTCRQALLGLRQRFPDASIYADYTGGTKTMTAGLVLAAIEDDRVELQLVTGGRVDLVRVRDGYESAAPANIETIRLQKNVQPHCDAWRWHAYAEAESGLRGLPTPRNSLLRGELNRARDLSAGLAAWDRFDHTEAMERLQNYASKLPAELSDLLGILRSLVDKNSDKRQAAQLLDLYRNVERRAIQGRYDDAIARLYRFLEWTAQWQLERHCGVKTSDVPADFAPHIQPNRDGKRQVGLFEAWRMVGTNTQGALSDFIRDQESYLLDHLRARNGSILAHGFEPIGRNVWDAFHTWIDSLLIPALLKETACVGIRKLPPQLPNQYPNSHHPS